MNDIKIGKKVLLERLKLFLENLKVKSLEDIPELEKYTITQTQAAFLLGFSRSRMSKILKDGKHNISKASDEYYAGVLLLDVLNFEGRQEMTGRPRQNQKRKYNEVK